MKPQKYAARRSTKENQTISTITSDRDAGPRHPPVNNAVQQQAMYDRDRLTQVKTYTDHSNGYGQRSGGTTTHYSKVSIERCGGVFLFVLIGSLGFNSYHLDENVPITIWSHKHHRVKTAKQRHHYRDIIRISIYLQWTVTRLDTICECIMHDIVRMLDKGKIRIFDIWVWVFNFFFTFFFWNH